MSYFWLRAWTPSCTSELNNRYFNFSLWQELIQSLFYINRAVFPEYSQPTAFFFKNAPCYLPLVFIYIICHWSNRLGPKLCGNRMKIIGFKILCWLKIRFCRLFIVRLSACKKLKSFLLMTSWINNLKKQVIINNKTQWRWDYDLLRYFRGIVKTAWTVAVGRSKKSPWVRQDFEWWCS